ncbi:MAG: long-chain-fatty-acid--CoA ligase [Deltaproteobacteria bacterium]|nr:long-chain-fatty-acid--CoA ligase [Deltaproteobacteria bacterium]
MNLGNYLDEAVRKYAQVPYLRFYDETVTYAEFGRRVNVLANALKKHGVKKGDFIHVLVQNSPYTLVSYFAIMKIGAVAGPINGWWKAKEVEYLLNDSQGPGLIIEDQYLDILKEIRPNCPNLKTVIQVNGEILPGHLDFDALLAEGDETPVVCEAAPDDDAYIFYTSGTTGNPKGVLLAHKSVLADINGVNAALNTEEGMVVLIFLPLFHVNAMLSTSSSMQKGNTVVLRKQFSASEFWEVVDKFKVNFWSAVPAVYQILLKDPGRQKFDLSSLKFGVCGAAPLSTETMNEFQATFNIPIVEGYGLTEATCVSTINPRDGVRKIGSIGLALPGQEVKILDPDGKECPPNVPGEICIKGDVVMKCYYNRPEATAETIKDGFLHTGDVAYKDDDGYIFIVDRIKDMIIRGGENIYPKEIDNVVMGHPKVAEAATVGVPDKTMGEEVQVFIVPREDDITEEEIIEHCKKHLASFKVPKYVTFLWDEDMPRNAVGKTLKKELRQYGTAPRPKKTGGPVVTVADIFGTMESRVNPEGVAGITANYGYIITGEGGGEYTVSVKDGVVKVLSGIVDPGVTTMVAAKDWIAITLGTLDGMTAFTSGRLKVEGDFGLLTKATKFFKKYTPPAAAPQATVADIFGTMESRVNPEGVAGITANYGYIITGEGGGEYTVSVKDGAVKVLSGIVDPGVTTTVSAKDWIAITLGKLDGMTAFTSGRLKVEGDFGLLPKATKFFKKYAPPAPVAEATVADIFGTMESRVNPEGVAGITANYGYMITGTGGGEYTVSVKDGAVKVLSGIVDPQVTTTCSAKDWIAITLGKLDGMTAFTSGRLKVEGDFGLLTKATKFFKKYAPPSAAADEPKDELIVLKQVLSIPQKFSTGPVMGKFLRSLKDKKIIANKCPKCGRLQLPAREACAECRVRATDWVEVGPEGVLTITDVAFYASPDPLTGDTRETPYCAAHILLDGCKDHETLWHELNPDDIGRAKKGMRVKPVWDDKRKGAITDIKYFTLID